MSDDDAGDEEIFYECGVCAGEMGRCRRSDGSSICKHNSCYNELRRRRAGGDEVRTALARPAKAARTSCFKIREVLGVDMCVVEPRFDRPTEHPDRVPTESRQSPDSPTVVNRQSPTEPDRAQASSRQ